MLSKIRSAARGIVFPTWSIPIALLLLTLLTYGLRALGLGFYWDDWPYLWIFHRFGADGIVRAFANDRPFLSVIYTISLSLLGESSQAWQIFALLARWLCGLGLWWVLSLAWPRAKHQAAWAACLFIVYPGFTQQWISIIYGQAFFLFAALFFSIGITLWLMRRRKSLSRAALAAGTLLALALSAFTMFSTEYFFGIELLRPILLWLILREEPRPEQNGAQKKFFSHSLVKAALWWLPYLALMVIFILWRSFVQSIGYGLVVLDDAVEKSALSVGLELAGTIISDLVQSTLVAWGQPLQLDGLIETRGAAWFRLLAMILFTWVVFFIYLAKLGARSDLTTSQEGHTTRMGWLNLWSIQAVLVGLLAFLAAGWPFWITRLPLRMGFPQDRFTLPVAVGGSLILAGLIDLLAKKRAHKAIILGLAVALAAGFHFNTALNYRQDWNTLRDFFWQLTWRAPSVQPNTLFLSDSLPFKYFEDDSLLGPLNWTFDPDGQSTEIGYALYDQYVRMRNLSVLIAGENIEKEYRGVTFSAPASQVLVVSYNPPGCVHVLDPVNDAQNYRLPDRLIQSLPFSNPSLVIQDSPTPAAPPTSIFGDEPKRRWCYYYEKAELARQLGDWGEIYHLSNHSIREGLRPEDPIEYLPFIEAYVRAGLADDAYQLTVSAYKDSPAVRPSLCAVWQRSFETVPDASTRTGKRYADVNRLLNCPIQETR